MAVGHVSKVLPVALLVGAFAAPGWGQSSNEARGNTHKASAANRSAVASARSANVASAALTAGAQDVLGGLAARASVIFAGRVLDVDRHDAAGYVDVKFRVEEPVRGASRSGVYVLREWAGLWSGEPLRYRVGQRMLMLLTARGPSGMSAPVGGHEGMIPIAAGAVEPLADRNGNAPAEDGSEAADVSGMIVDLRWVQTLAVRGVSYAAEPDPAAGGDGTPVDRWGPVAPVSVTMGAPDAQPTVGAVLAVLRTAAQSAASGGAKGEAAGNRHEGR